MARGTRSSQAAVEANGLAARPTGESVDHVAAGMIVDEQEPHAHEDTRKRSEYKCDGIRLSIYPFGYRSACLTQSLLGTDCTYMASGYGRRRLAVLC